MARVQELDNSEEDEAYEREMLRNGRRVPYGRRLEYGGRGSRRRPAEYEDLTDETESVDGGDYDLYGHDDSTVTYAVQLAMRDKEDQLVEKALERIRRAQILGKKNVRLSQRELAALERKRLQTDGSNGARRPRHPATAARPGSRRSGSGVPPEQQPEGPHPSFASDAPGGWARGAGPAYGRPSTSPSAHRPRTPTTQSLRPQQPQQPTSPPRPSYPPFPAERFPSNGRPPSTHPHSMYPRPLPDDPQWAPPYFNPAAAMNSYPADQPLYPPQIPTDLRAGPAGWMSYLSGMPSFPSHHRPSLDGRPSMGASQTRGSRRPPSESESDDSSEEEEEETESSEADDDEDEDEDEDEDDDDGVRIVQVAGRQGPPGLQRRTVSAGGRGGR